MIALIIGLGNNEVVVRLVVSLDCYHSLLKLDWESYLFEDDLQTDGKGIVELRPASCRMVPTLHHVDGLKRNLIIAKHRQIAPHVHVGRRVIRQTVIKGVKHRPALLFKHILDDLELSLSLFDVEAADGPADVNSWFHIARFEFEYCKIDFSMLQNWNLKAPKNVKQPACYLLPPLHNLS